MRGPAGEPRRARLGRARLLLVFTRALCRRDPLETVEATVRGGVDAVQVREKGISSGETLAWSKRVRDRLEGKGILLFVNDRVDLALLAGADGVHLGQEDLPAAEARRIAGEGFLIGVSTHDIDQVRVAARDGADFVGFGPVFPTRTKGIERGLGPRALREALAASTLPLFPIGGVSPENAPAIAFAGRAAVSSAILSADDPESAARAIARALAAPSP